jgi:F0F1-type ATP synthase membrane subunit c/vacuolar-type H+-ATPase subunit K
MHMDVDWGRPEPFHTYVALKPGTHADAFNRKLAGFPGRRSQKARHRTLFATPYADLYLYGKFENGAPVGTASSTSSCFRPLPWFILLIACINFTNLSTAKRPGASRKWASKRWWVPGGDTGGAVPGESLLMGFCGVGGGRGGGGVAAAAVQPGYRQKRWASTCRQA